MKKFICLSMFLSAVLFAGQAFADQYTVYCANGKIEIDSRDLAAMTSARGAGRVYSMASYDYRTAALDFAKKQGGLGASCPTK